MILFVPMRLLWRCPIVHRRVATVVGVLLVIFAGVSLTRPAWAPTGAEYGVMIAALVVVTLAAITLIDPGVGSNLPAPALSCPVFAGSGTLLGEDDCAWAKADTRWTVQSGTTGNATVLHFGGQKELMPGLFLSGAFGFGTQSTQNGNGTAGNGQIYDGSLALKYTNGPWFLAGAIAFSTNQLHLAPSALGLSGDANIYVGGARLRGAYDFAFTGWYLRPRLDLDVIQTWRPAFMLAGPGPSGLGQNALSVDSFDKTRFVASPMIELGGRFDFDERTVARPFLAVGATFLPDNNVTTSVNIAGQAATLGSLQSTGYGPSVLGNVQAGLQLYKTHGFEMKAEYALSVGDSYLSQGASLRGAYHF